MPKIVRGYANLGLVGCDAEVFELELEDEEFQSAVDSGEIYEWIIRDGVMQMLDIRYEVEDA